MTSINPNPEPFISLILFPVKPEKDESLKSWLDRKNHQREYFAEVARMEKK